MKIFISYRFTGENLDTISDYLDCIKDILEKKGHSVFSSFWEEDTFKKNNFTRKQLLDYVFQEIDKADACFVFVRSSRKSEGLLLEVGYALAKNKPLALIIKEDVETVFLKDIAKSVIKYNNLSDLKTKLNKIDLNIG